LIKGRCLHAHVSCRYCWVNHDELASQTCTCATLLLHVLLLLLLLAYSACSVQ
jgi:hypothetical protein